MDHDNKPPIETLYLYDAAGVLVTQGPPEDVMREWFTRGAKNEEKIEPAPRTNPVPTPRDGPPPEHRATVARAATFITTRPPASVVAPKVRAPVAPNTKAAEYEMTVAPARVAYEQAVQTAKAQLLRPPAPPPAPPPGVTVAQDRVARSMNFLADMGMTLAPTVYAPGRRVLPVGDDNFRIMQEEYEATPRTIDALEEVRDMIRAEDRRDTPAWACRDLYMDPAGWIHKDANTRGALPLEPNGLRSLLSYMGDVFPRANVVMAQAKPSVRANFFNGMIQDYGHLLQNDDGTPKMVVLRTRKFGSVRSIPAAVSPSYGSRNGDLVCEDMIAGLSTAEWLRDARGTVIYDPETSRLRADALRMASKIVDLACGDSLRGGARMSTDDQGGGSIRVQALMLRNLCLNLIILDEAKVTLVQRRHRGAMLNVTEDVATGLARVNGMIEAHAADWGLLRAAPIDKVTLWGEKFKDVPSALAWAVKDGRLDVDVRRDVLTQVLLEGYKAEPGNTLADMINAITRSHTSDMIDQWARERIERAAGELVPVLVRAAA